jgi:uncharacterized membrane protein
MLVNVLPEKSRLTYFFSLLISTVPILPESPDAPPKSLMFILTLYALPAVLSGCFSNHSLNAVMLVNVWAAPPLDDLLTLSALLFFALSLSVFSLFALPLPSVLPLPQAAKENPITAISAITLIAATIWAALSFATVKLTPFDSIFFIKHSLHLYMKKQVSVHTHRSGVISYSFSKNITMKEKNLHIECLFLHLE